MRSIMKYLDGTFRGHRNLTLYFQCWLPDDEPKVVLVVVHGSADHSGRYLTLVNHLVPRGYGIYGLDMRGNGKSEGLRGYVGRFSDYLDDLDTFYNLVRAQQPAAKIFAFGHSSGGTVLTAYAILRRCEFCGLILSGALLSPSVVPARTRFAAHVLSFFLPKIGIYHIAADNISRDKDVVKAYETDPLVYHGKISTRLGAELMKAMGMIRKRMADVRLPILILHGSADRLVDPKNSELLYREAGSVDKALRLYPGFYHSIINEPDHQQVLADIEAWLNAHS